jgi:hypothetical protein
MKTVVRTTTPQNQVALGNTDTASKLYGVQHREYREDNPKRYKVHRCRDRTYMAVGFLNSTGHLNESEGFESLASVMDYCEEHGHSLFEFDNAEQFADWLDS